MSSALETVFHLAAHETVTFSKAGHSPGHSSNEGWWGFISERVNVRGEGSGLWFSSMQEPQDNVLAMV